MGSKGFSEKGVARELFSRGVLRSNPSRESKERSVCGRFPGSPAELETGPHLRAAGRGRQRGEAGTEVIKGPRSTPGSVTPN